MLDLLLTSLLTSLLTLLGAWFFLHLPKGPHPPRSSLPQQDGEAAQEIVREGEENLLELEDSEEEWLLQESGHQSRPGPEVNSSATEIDAIRRRFARDAPPHLEVGLKGRGGAGGKARAASSSASRPQSRARIQCRQCQKDFTDEIALRQHQVFKHSGAGASKADLPPRAAATSTSNTTGTTRLVCDVCGKDHKTPSLLHQHKSERHPWSTFCVKCRVKFTSTFQATQHYKTAHMPRPKKPSPSKALVESGNYVPFEGFNPDPNIPEVQQTYGCSECKERFNSAVERDAHMKDLFAHPDPIALASAFPPLSSAYPSPPGSSSNGNRSSAQPAPRLGEGQEQGLGLGIEISSRSGIALDRMPLSFEHIDLIPPTIIAFNDDDHLDPPVHEIVIEAVPPLPAAEPSAIPFHTVQTSEAVAISFDDEKDEKEEGRERMLEPAVELSPSAISDTSSNSVLPGDSASNLGDLDSGSQVSTPESPHQYQGSASLVSSTISQGSSRPWYSPQPVTDDVAHPDASIQWGVPWSPPVPGPEFYPPLNGVIPPAAPAIWGPPSSIPEPLDLNASSPPPSESTEEETPPPETPPPPPLPSSQVGTTPSRWSIGEKPAFPMPDLTPRLKQKLTFSPPAPEPPKPDDITAPYIHPSRLQSSFPLEETEQHVDESSVHITGPNNIPISSRRSASNHYRLDENNDSSSSPYPQTSPPPTASIYAAASGFTQVDLLPQTHRRPITSPSSIEEQLPLFRHPKEGEEFRGYAPPGPTPAPPRAAAIAAWSKPAQKKDSTPISYEPTVHSSWFPPPRPERGPTPSSSSSGDSGQPYGKRAGRKNANHRDTTPKKSKFFNTLEPSFDADEWISEPMERKKPVVKMQPRRESPAPRLTFAQRTAAAAATPAPAFHIATDPYGQSAGSGKSGRGRGGGPPGSQNWTASQSTAIAASGGDDADEYGGW